MGLGECLLSSQGRSDGAVPASVSGSLCTCGPPGWHRARRAWTQSFKGCLHHGRKGSCFLKQISRVGFTQVLSCGSVTVTVKYLGDTDLLKSVIPLLSFLGTPRKLLCGISVLVSQGEQVLKAVRRRK